MRKTHIPALAAAMMLCAGAAATRPAGLRNAAQPEYGARISLSLGPKAGKNRLTPPESTFDGNAHTRCVLEGQPPYTFTVELIDRLPVEKVAFAHSDYEAEQAPKDIVIELDDGTRIEHTLALKRPENRRIMWQEVPVGRPAQTIRITVLSNYPGRVNWGGLGEIAVLTSADMDALLAVPGYDPRAPVFIRIPPESQAKVEVHLPRRVEKGAYPCTLFDAAELESLRKALNDRPRGRPALEALINVADGALKGALDFPDPKGTPAQLTDRSCPIARKHSDLSKACGTLAMAWAITGKQQYAQRAREILIGYAQRYADYPEHKGVNRSDTGKVMAQRLSEAMWLIPLIRGYELIQNADVLSADDRRDIESKLIRPAIDFIYRATVRERVAALEKRQPDWRNAEPPPPQRPGPVGNWLTFYAAAAITAGAVLGDRDLVDLTVYDVKGYLRDGIGEDGLWGEGATGYQMFALQALVIVLETAARQGHDLWGYRNCQVKKPFDSILRMAYPDGTAPGINDSGRVRLGNWSTMVYDFAWLRYRDPAYAMLVNASPRQLHMTEGVYFPTMVYDELPEPKSTGYGSAVFRNVGYAILRDEGRYLLMDYGPHGGVHGHYDKLNLLVFAGGDELGGEPVMHRYEDPLHAGWTIHTVAHNTVCVDQRSQSACTGRLLVFEDAGPIKVMRGEASGAYAGVLLDRTVAMLPDAIIDVFHCRSARPHTWDLTLRFNGTLEGMAAPAESSEKLGDRDGYGHLTVAGRSSPAGAWQGTWVGKAAKLRVAAAGSARPQVMACVGPDNDHIAIVRQNGPTADFATAMWLDGWGPAAADLRLVDTSDPLVTCAEMRREGMAAMVVVAHRPGVWRAAGWTSDARVLVVRQQGSKRQVLMAGGTHAESGSFTIRVDSPGSAFRADP